MIAKTREMMNTIERSDGGGHSCSTPDVRTDMN